MKPYGDTEVDGFGSAAPQTARSHRNIANRRLTVLDVASRWQRPNDIS